MSVSSRSKGGRRKGRKLHKGSITPEITTGRTRGNPTPCQEILKLRSNGGFTRKRKKEKRIDHGVISVLPRKKKIERKEKKKPQEGLKKKDTKSRSQGRTKNAARIGGPGEKKKNAVGRCARIEGAGVGAC